MQIRENPSPCRASARRTAVLAVLCAAGMATSSAIAVTKERLPVAMSVVNLPFSFSGDHGVDGSTGVVLDGLPLFDGRLGSLDQVVVTPDLHYSLPNLLYTVTASANQGYGTVRTLWTLNLENWLRDAQTGQRLEFLTEFSQHTATCGVCRPGSGSFGSKSSKWGDEDEVGDGSRQLIAATPKGAGLVVEDTRFIFVSSTGSERVNMQLGGTYSLSGQLLIGRTYHAYTTAQYIANAVQRTVSEKNPDLRGELAARELVALRTENDAATSAQNESLRSAEYGVMSYLGASEYAKNPSLGGYIAMVFQSPLGVAGHNTIKGCKALVPGCAALWKEVVGLLGETPTGPLPESRPGGLDASWRGFWHGVQNPGDIEGLAAAIDSNAPLPISADPLQPDLRLSNSDGSVMQTFQRTVISGQTLYLDPDPAAAILTFAMGAGITALELPSLPGTQSIDSFTVTAMDRSLVLAGGQLHDLVQLFGEPLDGFVVSELEGALLPAHLIIGMRFDRDAQVSIMQLIVAQPVPEPTTTVMLLAGLLVLGAWQRRRA